MSPKVAPPPPDWLELPADLLVFVFDKVNTSMPDGALSGFALGRLVCKSWCRDITNDLSASLKSFVTRGHISLLRLHERFPNLRTLHVRYLLLTHDHFAIFHFRKLERIILDGPDVKLCVKVTTAVNEPIIQVFFENTSTNCPKCLPKALREWFDDYLSDFPQLPFDKKKLARADSNVPFRVKGVGRRVELDTPVLYQVLGVPQKPVGWDIVEYLQLLFHPSYVGERLPFIKQCHKVAVQYRSVEAYVQPNRAILSMVESTVQIGARVWVCGHHPWLPEFVEKYRNRTMVWTHCRRMSEARPSLLELD